MRASLDMSAFFPVDFAVGISFEPSRESVNAVAAAQLGSFSGERD